jgi:hypothetical protein
MVDLVSQQQHSARAYLHTAFSESSGGSGHGRRDSMAYSTVGHGLMESPISTVSTSISGSAQVQTPLLSPQMVCLQIAPL